MRLLFLIVAICGLHSINAQYNSNIRLEKLLQTNTTSIGQSIQYPCTNHAEVTMMKVTIPPGCETGWHHHNSPMFASVIQGNLSIEMKDGPTLTFVPGNTFAEIINIPHNGSNHGTEDVVLWVIYLGEKGQPLSQKEPSQPE